MKRLIALLALASFLTACSKHQDPVPQATVPAPTQAPVTIVNNVTAPETPAAPPASAQGSGLTSGEAMLVGGFVGLAAGMVMSNGERYNGHNWQGPPPRGYDMDPVTRVVVRHEYIHKYQAAPQSVRVAAEKPVVQPARTKEERDAKRNPGNAVAKVEANKMAQEKALAEQKRKDDLKARKASLYKARDTNQKSGFNKMSKSRK